MVYYKSPQVGHNESALPDRPYACPNCDYLADGPDDMRYHLERHRPARLKPVYTVRGKLNSIQCPNGCGRWFVERAVHPYKREIMDYRAHVPSCKGEAPLNKNEPQPQEAHAPEPRTVRRPDNGWTRAHPSERREPTMPKLDPCPKCERNDFVKAGPRALHIKACKGPKEEKPKKKRKYTRRTPGRSPSKPSGKGLNAQALRDKADKLRDDADKRIREIREDTDERANKLIELAQQIEAVEDSVTELLEGGDPS